MSQLIAPSKILIVLKHEENVKVKLLSMCGYNATEINDDYLD